jgi:acetyltransferase-like isoleucine patch superfamily enzyme
VHETFASWVIGSNTQIDIGQVEPSFLKRMLITAGNDCHIVLKSFRALHPTVVITMKNDSVLEFGEGQIFNGGSLFQMPEPSRIIVGSDCAFADGIVLTSDYHSIIDSISGRCINHAQDVVIGDRVWLCKDFTVLKGAKIGNDSVVATKSVVTSVTYENNVVLAGNPAKVVKRNITWDMALLP